MSDHRLLGTTEVNSIAIDLDQLGAPGVQGCLVVEAQFSDNRYEGKDRRKDRTPRSFLVKCRLSKLPQDRHDMRGDMSPDDGSSFLLVPPGKNAVEVTFQNVRMVLEANEAGELSMVSSRINAVTADHARTLFLDFLTRYVDHASYLYATPIHLDLLAVHDEMNEVQYIYFVAPPRLQIIAEGGETVSNEMKAVYALYREAMNASSPYYRVLCLYKIMEGLLGPLRTSIQRRAKAAKIDIASPKALVPDHIDIPDGLREQVGKPIKHFFDRFLTKQYRDTVAHFLLRERNALDLSAPRDVGRFTDVAFLADLAARVLIQQHEAALRKLEANAGTSDAL